MSSKKRGAKKPTKKEQLKQLEEKLEPKRKREEEEEEELVEADDALEEGEKKMKSNKKKKAKQDGYNSTVPSFVTVKIPPPKPNVRDSSPIQVIFGKIGSTDEPKTYVSVPTWMKTSDSEDEGMKVQRIKFLIEKARDVSAPTQWTEKGKGGKAKIPEKHKPWNMNVTVLEKNKDDALICKHVSDLFHKGVEFLLRKDVWEALGRSHMMPTESEIKAAFNSPIRDDNYEGCSYFKTRFVSNPFTKKAQFVIWDKRCKKPERLFPSAIKDGNAVKGTLMVEDLNIRHDEKNGFSWGFGLAWTYCLVMKGGSEDQDDMSDTERYQRDLRDFGFIDDEAEEAEEEDDDGEEEGEND